MNNKSSIGNDAVRLTVSKMMVMVISMVSAMLLSRFRTVEEYGTYSQLLMIINLVTTIIMMGLPNSLNYFLAGAETGKDRGHFLNVYYSLSTLLSALVGFVLVLLTPVLVLYFDNPMLTGFIYFLAVFPWTKIIMSSVENVLVVYGKTRFIMIFRLANSVMLLGIILLVQVLRWTFTAYIAFYLAVEVLFSVAVYFIAKSCAGSLRPEIDWELTKKIFKFSVPIGLASMVGTLNIELDKLLIGGLMDTESLAIYTNASKEMPVTIIASSVTAVLLPQMVRLLKKNENKTATELWNNATYISFSIITFLALALFVFAPEVMTILYSEKYLAGVSVFRVYNILLILRCTYFGMVLNASGHTKFIFFSSIASLCMNVCLNFILFYLFGFIGPAIASFVAQLAINLVQLIWTSKILKVKFSGIFNWSLFAVSFLVNAVLAVIFAVMKNILPLEAIIGEIIESILLGAVWALAFAAVYYKNIKKRWVLLNSTKGIQ